MILSFAFLCLVLLFSRLNTHFSHKETVESSDSPVIKYKLKQTGKIGKRRGQGHVRPSAQGQQESLPSPQSR